MAGTSLRNLRIFPLLKIPQEEKKMAYIHVYTGNGKGKSTAAFGLAVRAHYAGMKV